MCLNTCILFANRCILAACTTSTRCSCSQHLQLPPHVSSHASVSALITQALFVQDSATPLPAHILLSAFSQGSCCIGWGGEPHTKANRCGLVCNGRYTVGSNGCSGRLPVTNSSFRRVTACSSVRSTASCVWQVTASRRSAGGYPYIVSMYSNNTNSFEYTQSFWP